MLAAISVATQKKSRIGQCRLCALCSNCTERTRTVSKALFPPFIPVCGHKLFKGEGCYFQERV